MDTKTQQQTKGAGHQHRAEFLARWLEEFTASPGGVAGSVDTRGYVIPEGAMAKRQAE